MIRNFCAFGKNAVFNKYVYTKIVLRLFTTFVVVAAILASPKRRVFIWSFRSSIYTVHCSKLIID